MSRTTVDGRRQLTGGGWSIPALAVAALWSVLLVVGALVAPAYQSSTTYSRGTADGPITGEVTSTRTLVEVNGAGVLLVVAVPLAGVAAVSLSLLSRRRRRRAGAGPLAWTVVGLLGALAFVALMSVGIFMLPAVALLGLACAGAPRPDHRPPPPSTLSSP